MPTIQTQKHEEDLIKEILRSKFPEHGQEDIDKMFAEGLKLAPQRIADHERKLRDAMAKPTVEAGQLLGASPALSACWANAASLRDAAITACTAAGHPFAVGACIAAAWVAYSAACNWCTQTCT